MIVVDASTERGRVVLLDYEHHYGLVQVGRRKLRFDFTSFDGGRPRRGPRIEDEVEVLLRDDGAVLRVRLPHGERT